MKHFLFSGLLIAGLEFLILGEINKNSLAAYLGVILLGIWVGILWVKLENK